MKQEAVRVGHPPTLRCPTGEASILLQMRRETSVMKRAIFVCLVVSAAIAFSLRGDCQAGRSSGPGGNWLATRRYWTQGGVGGINEHLYVVANLSGRNELILEVAGKKESWTGKEWQEGEVVFVYGERVYTSNRLPSAFDMSKAIVVSFEGRRIRFFDFAAMQGGYFDRS